jgi:hypothetical protein
LGFASSTNAHVHGTKASGAVQGCAPMVEKRRRGAGSARVGDVGVAVTSVGEELVKSRRRGELLRRRVLALLRLPTARGQPSLLLVRLRLQHLRHRQGGTSAKCAPAPLLPSTSSSLLHFPSLGGEQRNQRGKTPIELCFATGTLPGGLEACARRSKGRRVTNGSLLACYGVDADVEDRVWLAGADARRPVKFISCFVKRDEIILV